jgi:hypothetical protein
MIDTWKKNPLTCGVLWCYSIALASEPSATGPAKADNGEWSDASGSALIFPLISNRDRQMTFLRFGDGENLSFSPSSLIDGDHRPVRV